MQFFTFNNRRSILVFLLIIIYIFSINNSAFASGGSGNWDPIYSTDESQTSDISTFGVWVCTIAAKLTFWLPSTPSGLWLSSLTSEIASDIPFVGTGIFYAVIGDIRNVLILVASWKVFKSLSRF